MVPGAQPSVITQWLDELKTVRRYSAHTLASYARDLRRLEQYRAQYVAHLDIIQLSSGHIRQALGVAHKEGLEARSLARLLAAWRSFFDWAIKQLGIQQNPAQSVKAPKTPKLLPKALSVEQVQALLEPEVRADSTPPTPVWLRDKAMFELFYSSGLRLSELVDLDSEYVQSATYRSNSWMNWQEREVLVTGKGGKVRIVPIGNLAYEALQAWLSVRPSFLSPQAEEADTFALFLGVRGKRITSRVVQLQLAAWAQQSALPTHVHPHVLRHSFASHVLQSSEDLRAVQELLGHSSIATTQIYTRLDFQHLAKVYDKAHPRAQRKNK